MDYEQIIPESYPVHLINKDWTKRICYQRLDFAEFTKKLHYMNVLDDDVWIITTPKAGTTWMQELLWLLMNDCDFSAALSKDLELRSSFVEWDVLVKNDPKYYLKAAEELPSPRLIKSHLPLPLLPAQLWQGKAKVVYVFRNPIDACISSYYHGVTVGYNCGQTLSEFCDSYWETHGQYRNPIDHAAEFYQLRNEPWVYYTSFNRMKSDLRGVIEDLCKFLNKSVTEEQMEQLLKHLSFEEMKKNPTTNHLWEFAQLKSTNTPKEVHNFVRRGKVDGYKDDLTPDQIEKGNRFMDKYLHENQVTLDELLLLNES